MNIKKEEGLYSKVFKVKKWKKYLPDGAVISKEDYRMKSMKDFSKENLELFLKESCRAELNHLLAITPFWVFGLFVPPRVVIYMLAYALIVNMPCIIVQRYNRPRIIRMLGVKNLEKVREG